MESGYALEIGTQISNRINGTFMANLLPWQRVLACIKKGTYDITFPIQSKPERKAFMVFTDVILEDRVFLWHLKERKDNIVRWETLDDLRPYTISIISGYTYQDKMNQAIEKKIRKTEKVFFCKQAF